MKQSIRKEMREKRRALSETQIKHAAQNICEKVCITQAYKNAKTVCLYLSAYKEVDTAPLLAKCIQDGKTIVLPVTDESGKITLYQDNGKYKRGNFGITEPDSNKTIRPNNVDLFIVPGLAFDKNGNRLGFGMGCYDRLLHGTNGYKIGICYEFQFTDALPADEHDIKMDEIIYA